MINRIHFGPNPLETNDQLKLAAYTQLFRTTNISFQIDIMWYHYLMRWFTEDIMKNSTVVKSEGRGKIFAALRI